METPNPDAEALVDDNVKPLVLELMADRVWWHLQAYLNAADYDAIYVTRDDLHAALVATFQEPPAEPAVPPGNDQEPPKA